MGSENGQIIAWGASWAPSARHATMSPHRLNPETQRQHRLNRESTLRLKKHDLGRCAELLVPICLAVLERWASWRVGFLSVKTSSRSPSVSLGILERWIPQCADLPVPICLAVLPGILKRWVR